MKVSDILSKKGHEVYTIAPEQSVFEALKIMSEKNIGALMVIENGLLSGIFSERDYARKIILKGKNSFDTPVKDIMTENVISVRMDSSLEQCMELMSEHHVRHLPVKEAEEVRGVISITDVVTAIIQSQMDTIENLKNYLVQ